MFLFRYLFISLICVMSMAQIGHAQSIDDDLRQKLQLTMPKARVTQVIDGQTFVVNNTKTIHLPAMYIPWESPHSQGEYGARAKKFLEETIMEEFVRIYQVRNNDRALFNALGHHEGYVTVDGQFVQSLIVEKGLAFAYPSQSHYVVADILYDAEEKAKEAKVGFWADDTWEIKTPETVTDIENQFVIVEGAVKKVASRNNVIYLNFGDDWRTDFTIAASSGLRRDFSKAGINVMQLGGQKIRARGWARDYNGAYLEVFHPSQVEILNEKEENNENTQ